MIDNITCVGCVQKFIGHSQPVHQVGFTPDQLGVVSVGDAIFLWDFLAHPVESSAGYWWCWSLAMVQTCCHGTTYSIMSDTLSMSRSPARRGTRSASQLGTSVCFLVLLQQCNRQLMIIITLLLLYFSCHKEHHPSHSDQAVIPLCNGMPRKLVPLPSSPPTDVHHLDSVDQSGS